MKFSATYSPDDNKLRLYASSRLDSELYTRVRAAGFIWAPKQDLFVAPKWTPDREDLLLELAGEIDDEDTSLTERAEVRAERFDGYQERRASDAEQAAEGVRRIADGIPLGQPILIGHHSERHARKDAERIENGMRRAVKMWETAEYWTSRAAGALAHAKYKERPDVRARRIKTLESERRKIAKNVERSETLLKAWEDPTALRKGGQPAPMRDAVLYIANVSRAYWSLCHTYPSGYTGTLSLWEAVRDGIATPEEACAKGITQSKAYLNTAARWIGHYDNRLAYERALLGESGYIAPPKAPTRAALPLLNYAGTVVYKNRYTGEEITTEAHGMTAAEYAAINKDYKGTFISADGTHRVRSAMIRAKGHGLCAVYLTDKKQHPKPGAGAATRDQAEIDRRAAEGLQAIAEAKAEAAEVKAHNRAVIRRHHDTPAAPAEPTAATLDRSTVDEMRATLKAGVTVAVVPDLFPTPTELAQRMAQLAEIEEGHRVLEPSAGTGNLLVAILEEYGSTDLVAVEANFGLAKKLRVYGWEKVHCADFLELSADLGTFDRIVMNPPFTQGADIRHILHARELLKPGGRLVALCANGPRQREKLQPIAETWEDLEDGTFAAAGTNVRVALLTIAA